MLWDEPKIFFLERRYFFSIILSEFLKNRVALQKGYRSLAYIMDSTQKPGMREQRFLALKAHGPFYAFGEPLPD